MSSEPVLPQQKVTVLLIDNQPMIGEAVRRTFAGEPDIEFHYCRDAAKAIEEAVRIKPTVIVQDWVMEGIDVLNLVTTFRANEQTRGIPIIVLSPKDDPAVMAEAFALGANDYIVKLPDRLEMLARIRYQSKSYIDLAEQARVHNRVSKLLEQLLHMEEGATLDFKRDQYPFIGADNDAKSELLKDILAFANAWRSADAYILIGVEELRGARSRPVGVTTVLDDASLQQFVNAKTNRPIAFSCETAAVDGVQVGIIRIEVQERPVFLKKDFGKLKAHAVYIRRGSSTDTADPEEIHRMGAASARQETAPRFDEKLQVSLHASGQATTPPPFGSGEPLHLAIDLVVNNVGNSPVFIVGAKLKDPTGRRSIDFSDVCDEKEPLPPGGRRKSTMKMLHHGVFPPAHASDPRLEHLRYNNRFYFRLLRFICQPGAAFHVETGRGTVLTYRASEVCDAPFLNWPYLATPKEILDELGGKTLDDFENELREAFQRAGAEISASTEESTHPFLNVELLSFAYQEVTNDPSDSLIVLSPTPRCFSLELGITNVSDRPMYIRSVCVTVGDGTYKPDHESEVIRIEAHEYKEIELTLPDDDGLAPRSGEFQLELLPAEGKPIRIAGTFPFRSRSD